MYIPKNPHIPEPPTKKLTLLAALSFASFLIMTVVMIIVVVLLVAQYGRVHEKQNQIDLLSSTLQRTTDQLTITQRKLIVQTLLPPPESFTQQCPGGNTKDGLFTPLNDTPIEGYNVFLVDCRSNIGMGKSAPRVLVFRVNDNGDKEFTYGANANEPLCITNKIPTANKIAAKLELPVCVAN